MKPCQISRPCRTANSTRSTNARRGGVAGLHRVPRHLSGIQSGSLCFAGQLQHSRRWRSFHARGSAEERVGSMGIAPSAPDAVSRADIRIGGGSGGCRSACVLARCAIESSAHPAMLECCEPVSTLPRHAVREQHPCCTTCMLCNQRSLRSIPRLTTRIRRALLPEQKGSRHAHDAD